MKIAAYVSGAITALLLLLLLTGWADADDGIKRALRLGNEQYASAAYEEALKLYEAGLIANPEHKALNFNAAQAAYMLGDYEKAAQYYEKAADSADKYLNAGNIFFWVGEAIQVEAQDANQDAAQNANLKLQFYALALQIYQEGISKYPQDVPLKYNYELAKEKIKELLEDMEQESEDSQSDDQDEGEDSEESEANQDQAAEDTQDGQEQEQGDEQEEDSAETQDDGQEGEAAEEEEANSADEDENDPDMEAIERILQMLELQEIEGLKNNQEVVEGNDGGVRYEW
jgi:Ca-activated chloride channel family protein